jgi:exodeoxyribonuclease V alpha subunit
MIISGMVRSAMPQTRTFIVSVTTHFFLREFRGGWQIEESFKGRLVCDAVKEREYLPPCYWSINAQGRNVCPVEDPHPFTDTGSWGARFRSEVPPLKDNLQSFSVFTWCFKLSFERENADQYYPPPEELEKRVIEHINELQEKKNP